MTPENIKLLFDALYAPQAWLLAQNPYISMTFIGFVLAAALALSGFVLARMGHKPLWAILVIVPTVQIIALWVLALTKFPREKIKS